MNSFRPTVMVVFGATGDLNRRYIVPGLYNLLRHGYLPEPFQLIGFARRPFLDEEFRVLMAKALEDRLSEKEWDDELVEKFLQMISYHQGTFEDEASYHGLASTLGLENGEWTTCMDRLFYLATPPRHYPTIIEHIDSSGLNNPCSDDDGAVKILIEKPFGRDVATAEALDKTLGERFSEDQIFRIDHYLAKETIQNILSFRFSNILFEPVWNKEYIEKVEIKMHESIAVEGRGALYDNLGALRDVGQNHLLQMLALTAMDNPGEFTAENIRKERHAVLEKLLNIDADMMTEQTVRGQYVGYTDEDGVADDSEIETFFRITAYLDDPQWEGVPFVLEHGKGLDERNTEIVVTFRAPITCLCPPEPGREYKNVLTLRIQPRQGMDVCFWVRRPGLEMVLDEKRLEFDYATAYADLEVTDAYEKILLDAIRGDQTLFATTEELLDSWDFIGIIREAWDRGDVELVRYALGSKAEEIGR